MRCRKAWQSFLSKAGKTDPFHFCNTQEWLSVPFHTHDCLSPQTQVWTEQGQLVGERNLSKGEWVKHTEPVCRDSWGHPCQLVMDYNPVRERVLSLPKLGDFCCFSVASLLLLVPAWIEDRLPKPETLSQASFKPPITCFPDGAKLQARAQLWVDEEPPWSLGVYFQDMLPPSAEPEAEPLGLSHVSFMIFLVAGQSSNSDTIGKASCSPPRSVQQPQRLQCK